MIRIVLVFVLIFSSTVHAQNWGTNTTVEVFWVTRKIQYNSPAINQAFVKCFYLFTVFQKGDDSTLRCFFRLWCCGGVVLDCCIFKLKTHCKILLIKVFCKSVCSSCMLFFRVYLQHTCSLNNIHPQKLLVKNNSSHRGDVEIWISSRSFTSSGLSWLV